MIDKLALFICGLFFAYIFRAVFPAWTDGELAKWYYRAGFYIFVASVGFLLFSISALLLRSRYEGNSVTKASNIVSIIFTIFLGFFIFYLP